jgi:hypothetical protein
LCLTAEIGARLLVPKMSNTLSRIRLEANAARALAATNHTAKEMLIVGLMPPLTVEHTPALQQLGRELGVPILTPLTDQDLARDDYEADQYHLNSNGRLSLHRCIGGAIAAGIAVNLEQSRFAPA